MINFLNYQIYCPMTDFVKTQDSNVKDNLLQYLGKNLILHKEMDDHFHKNYHQ